MMQLIFIITFPASEKSISQSFSHDIPLRVPMAYEHRRSGFLQEYIVPLHFPLQLQCIISSRFSGAGPLSLVTGKSF